MLILFLWTVKSAFLWSLVSFCLFRRFCCWDWLRNSKVSDDRRGCLFEVTRTHNFLLFLRVATLEIWRMRILTILVIIATVFGRLERFLTWRINIEDIFIWRWWCCELRFRFTTLARIVLVYDTVLSLFVCLIVAGLL